MLRFIQHFLKFQFLVILISILAGIYYTQILDFVKSYFQNENINTSTCRNIDKNTKIPDKSKYTKEILFTKDLLSNYNGSDDKSDIYISILGSVFDVTKGRKFYGNGCTYNALAGRDASVSFVTGNFEMYNENSDDVNKMELSQILELNNWRNFYHKEYLYKGKLIGRFYDEKGRKTPYHLRLDELIFLAKTRNYDFQNENNKFPNCNIEWNEKTGTRVWCTKSSGGIVRNWVGVPRKYIKNSNENEFRCACVSREFLDSPKLRMFDNCDSNSNECFYETENVT